MENEKRGPEVLKIANFITIKKGGDGAVREVCDLILKEKKPDQINNFKVLFLYPNERSMSLVPPSIALLSSILKENGIEVDLFDTSFYKMKGSNSDLIGEKNLTFHPLKEEDKISLKEGDVFLDFEKKVSEFKPDLIAVTSTDSTFLIVINLLKAVKKYNIPTILGGVFATFAPEVAIKYPEMDFLCVGEGESTLPELCEKMIKKEDVSKILGLWMKQNGQIIKNKMAPPSDLNKLPKLDFGLFDEKRLYRMMGGKYYKMLPVETHRGCPYMCTYCGSPTQNKIYLEQTHQKFYRQKSIQEVKKAILYYKKNLIPTISFFGQILS